MIDEFVDRRDVGRTGHQFLELFAEALRSRVADEGAGAAALVDDLDAVERRIVGDVEDWIVEYHLHDSSFRGQRRSLGERAGTAAEPQSAPCCPLVWVVAMAFKVRVCCCLSHTGGIP